MGCALFTANPRTGHGLKLVICLMVLDWSKKVL